MEIRKAIEEDAEGTGELLVYCYDMPRGAIERFLQSFNKVKEEFYSVIEDEEVVVIYKALGFVRAGKTEPMWIYAGNEH